MLNGPDRFSAILAPSHQLSLLLPSTTFQTQNLTNLGGSKCSTSSYPLRLCALPDQQSTRDRHTARGHGSRWRAAPWMEEDGVCDQSALCNERPLEVVDILIPTPQEPATSLARRHRVPAKRIAAGDYVRAESSHGAVSRSVVVSYAPRRESAGRVGALRGSRMRALGCGGLEIHTYYPAVAVSAAIWRFRVAPGRVYGLDKL